MSFMPSDVLPARTTLIESKSGDAKDAFTRPPAASLSKLNPDAIFAVVPINVDSYGPYGKPNAIVRPVRRNEPDEMVVPQSNEVALPASNQSTPKVNVPAKTKRREIDTFTKELDNKLRHLQRDKTPSSKNVKLISCHFLAAFPWLSLFMSLVAVCVRENSLSVDSLWFYCNWIARHRFSSSTYRLFEWCSPPIHCDSRCNNGVSLLNPAKMP